MAVPQLLTPQTPSGQTHSCLQALVGCSPELFPLGPHSVPRAWLVEKAPTLDLRVFEQEQEGVADCSADCHCPSKQQINDSHQQVLVSEFCVWVLFLLGETR